MKRIVKINDIVSGNICLLDWPVANIYGSTHLYSGWWAPFSSCCKITRYYICVFRLMFFTFAVFTSFFQLPLYFVLSLGCYGLLMVGVGRTQFRTCLQEAVLLQQVSCLTFLFIPESIVSAFSTCKGYWWTIFTYGHRGEWWREMQLLRWVDWLVFVHAYPLSLEALVPYQSGERYENYQSWKNSSMSMCL